MSFMCDWAGYMASPRANRRAGSPTKAKTSHPHPSPSTEQIKRGMHP